MATTFYELHSQLRAEIGDYFPVSLAKLYIQRAVREIADRHQWSWLLRVEEIVAPAILQGTVTVVRDSLTVTVNTELADAINALTTVPIGRRQLRIGSGGGSLYEIREWDGTSTLTLNWAVPLADGDYSAIILKCYYLPPSIEQAPGVTAVESSNFKTYIDVRDKSNNFPLILDHNSEWIDKRDPRRDSTGTPTHFLQMHPTTSHFAGAGNSPGQYPPGGPRRELWPAPTSTYTYDCLYEMATWPLADDRTSALPDTLNPDLVHNTALVKAYRWAMAQRGGTSRASLGQYSTLIQLAAAERERLYLEAYREDQLYYESRQKDLLGGKFPYVMGAAYAQVHDINLMGGLVD